ncbi:hypothetical protein BaRGS_00024326 [Batillaria attramentaria]|uniref:THD domain-containing protein n=1 Tax=Batillaria attramentaria TaxID=370345 RepID=A0ABD0KBG1_9CAEN
MTGTVHFSVPESDRMDGHGHGHPRRPGGRLLRPVSMEEAENSVNEIHESLPRRAAVRLYRQISSGFNSRTIRCILVVSLCLNLIFAVLIGIFVGFWQSSREFESARGGSKVFAPGTDHLTCLPCSDNGIPGLVIAVRSKNGVCCTQDTVPGFDQSNRLFQLTTEYVRAHCPEKNSEPGGWSHHGGNGRPTNNDRYPSAAHLMLDVTKSKENLRLLPSGQHYLAWKTKDESGTSFISDDLRYVNGTITIPAAARYHMYSHLTFDTIMNQIPKQLVVDHSILRISRGAQQQLVLDRVTLTQNKIKSSDLEGTFELRQGDIIKVMVSYPSYLYNVPQTNAMGLFKLVFG